MQRLSQFYRKLPKRFTNAIEIIAIVLGLMVMVIIANMAKDGSTWAIILFSIGALLILGTGPFKRWQASRRQAKLLLQRQRAVEGLLAGRSREEVLAEAPFSYSRWPDGDNNFVIGDDRVNKIIHQVSSPGEAELWILEHYLADS